MIDMSGVNSPGKRKFSFWHLKQNPAMYYFIRDTPKKGDSERPKIQDGQKYVENRDTVRERGS